MSSILMSPSSSMLRSRGSDISMSSSMNKEDVDEEDEEIEREGVGGEEAVVSCDDRLSAESLNVSGATS